MFILVDLCQLSMLLNDYVTLCGSLRIMWRYEIHQGLCDIKTFIRVMWHCNVGLWHCDIDQGLCCIVTFLRGYLALWNFLYYLNGYVTLWPSLRIMWHCDFHQGLCDILMLDCDIPQWLYPIEIILKGHVESWHKSLDHVIMQHNLLSTLT